MTASGAADAGTQRYAATATLRDGGSISIRDLRPDDKARLLAHFQALSPRSRYLRFLATKKSLSDQELREFTELDFPRRAALVATLRQAEDERIIGVARTRCAGRARRAEVGFAVLDEYPGRGIGPVLLEHLATLARRNGIAEFEAEVPGENNQMLRLFAARGLTVTPSLEGGVFHVSFPTEATDGYLEAHDRRDRHAAAESIRFVLEPRAVAVIGASREPGTIGAVLVENLTRCGFRGPIYPVNPAAQEIAGLPAYPSVGAIGQPVDLAVVAVPARVGDVIASARAPAYAVVVISAGFGEPRPQGATRNGDSSTWCAARGCGWSGPTAWASSALIPRWL